MKYFFNILLTVIILLSIPTFTFAEFFRDGGVPIDPSFPEETIEGSGFASKSFTASTGNTITFSYNFITNEISDFINDPNPDLEPVNDWFGVVLMDPNDGSILDFEKINDVLGATWTLINNGNTVYGPEGDPFLHETGKKTGSYQIPTGYNDTSVIFGIGVFDIGDPDVPSAVLIDNITLSGGDFTNDPFSESGYFGSADTYAGSGGLFVWMEEDYFSSKGVTEPGSGSFAYISTYDSSLAPVPIPSALWLFGSGLIGLAGLRKKYIK